MKNINFKSIKNIDIKKKILLSYLVIIVIFFLPTALFSALYSGKYAKAEAESNATHVIDEIYSNIEDSYESLKTVTDSFMKKKNGNDYISSYISNDYFYNVLTSSSENEKVKLVYDNFMKDLTLTRNDIKGINIKGSNGIIYSYYPNKNTQYEFGVYNFYMLHHYLDESKYPVNFTPTHKQYFTYGDPVYSLERVIFDVTTRDNVGYMNVDFDLTSFKKIINNCKLSKDEKLVIYDNEGNIIYNYNASDIIDGNLDKYLYTCLKDNIFKMRISNNELQTVKVNNVDYTMISKTGNFSNINISYFIPKKVAFAKSRFLTKIILIVSLIALLLSFACANLLSHLVVKPIKNLSKAMNKVGDGNLNVKVDYEGKDEVGILAENYNKMVESLKYHIEVEYKLNLVKKEAEYKALIQQINPHFIYNTLELISGAAMEAEVPVIDKIAVALGQMLRYSVRNDSGMVALSEELTNLKYYLQLYNYRFENRVMVIYNIREEDKKQKVPKMFLQLIIENSLNHGIEKVKRKGIIEISTSNKDNCFVTEIKDNGIGISKDKLEKMNEILEGDIKNSFWDSNKDMGIGLRNINARLFLIFGEKYKMKINSEIGKYTSIQIIIPL